MVISKITDFYKLVHSVFIYMLHSIPTFFFWELCKNIVNSIHINTIQIECAITIYQMLLFLLDSRSC